MYSALMLFLIMLILSAKERYKWFLKLCISISLDDLNSIRFIFIYFIGQSIWIWKRKQGVCSGRLKPIIDIQV